MEINAKGDYVATILKHSKASATGLFIICLWLTNLTNAQRNFVEIKGVVKDKEDKTLLPGAVCFFKNNEHIGNVTDASGYFKIKYPKELSYDPLIISMLGYHRLNVSVRSLSATDTIVFLLERNAIVLKDIVIRDEKFDLKQLVLKAIENIPKNFPNKPHWLEAFYRKVSTHNNQYTHLEEAVIRIQDDNYKILPNASKIEVLAYRESKDWGAIDSITVKILSKTRASGYNNWQTAFNPLNRLYENNNIRLFNIEVNRFNPKSFKKYMNSYLAELVDIYTVNQDTIFHIAFNDSAFPAPPSGRNYLKVNMTDHAIIEYQISSQRNGHILYQELFKFQKIEGRYYPKFLKVIKPRLINRDTEDGEYDIATIWFDSVKIKDFEKVKPKHAIDRLDKQGHKKSNYDPELWLDLNMLNKYPLERGVLKSLESYQPLEEQFKLHE